MRNSEERTEISCTAERKLNLEGTAKDQFYPKQNLSKKNIADDREKNLLRNDSMYLDFDEESENEIPNTSNQKKGIYRNLTF